jgi:phosphoglycolate phosphatase-like HAD superfamily hydrolase
MQIQEIETLTRFDALVFDFDGVLVESTDIKTMAFATLYKHHGQAIVEQVTSYHAKHAGISRFKKFKYFQENLLGLPYSEKEGNFLSNQFSKLVVDAVVDSSYVAGAKEFLETHINTIPMFIASGTPNDELHEIVKRRDMLKYFVSVFGTPSTKGEIIKKLLQDHAFAPMRVLMVGDALADLDGARESGVGFIGRISGDDNPFPPGVDVIPDLNALANYVWR